MTPPRDEEGRFISAEKAPDADEGGYRTVPASDLLKEHLTLLERQHQDARRRAVNTEGELRDIPDDAIFNPDTRDWLIPADDEEQDDGE